MMREGSESGMALVTVLIFLGAMGLLMAGVYSLVFEGTRSANQNVSYQVSFSSSMSGTERLESLINRVAIPGYNPPAPPGYGVQADKCGGSGAVINNNGVWDSCQAFADYLRDQIDRGHADAEGDHYPSDPNKVCDQNRPDIRYTVPTSDGQVTVAICVQRAGAGSLPGSGSGVIFANAQGNVANSQSGFEVDVWASGSRSARSQLQGVARGIY